MNIYLGLSGSEVLITNYSRDFKPSTRESYEDVITENETTYRYSTGNVKHIFSFGYGTIIKTDLDVIETEYDRHVELSLKVEKDTNSNTYDTYIVLFDGEMSKPMDMDYPDRRDYKDVSFVLKEV